MPDEISWAVDEIVTLLNRTDIEETLKGFGEKFAKDDPIVHFYETFLAEYDPKVRETMGVYYTPAPIVDYIVRSVDSILKRSFGKKDGLADNDVLVLDPAVGTGSFLKRTIEIVQENFIEREGAWNSYVSDHLLQRLYGFEILMAPCAVAHLKLGMLLKEGGYRFEKKQRLRVYLPDTLEEAAKKSQQLLFRWISDEANEASDVKKEKPIMVVVGNPPYQGASQNKGQWILGLLKGNDRITGNPTASYFHVEGGNRVEETQMRWLHDDYVKFIRFAQWRVETTGHGVVAFVTNNGFLENRTFRGMRHALLQSFDEIYLINLHGNSKKREKCLDGSPDQNVFDIAQGVSICFLVKKIDTSTKPATVFIHDIRGLRDKKYAWLQGNDIESTAWRQVVPVKPFYLFADQEKPRARPEKEEWGLNRIFPVHSVGIITARDHLCVKYSVEEVWDTVQRLRGIETEEARIEFKLGEDARDWKVAWAQKDLNAEALDRARIMPIMYRPFDKRYTYYTGRTKGFHCRPMYNTMKHMLKGTNVAVCTTKSTASEVWDHAFCASTLVQHHTVSVKEVNYVFPLRLDDDLRKSQLKLIPKGSCANISDDFVQTCRARLHFQPEPDHIFSYIYGLLFSPSYRSAFRLTLRIDFPHIVLPQSGQAFREISELGLRLMSLHQMEAASIPRRHVGFRERGDCRIEQVSYDAERCTVRINDEQFFPESSQSCGILELAVTAFVKNG